MTVKQLALDPLFDTVCMPSGDREIEGVYIGDLLSWVMGRAEADNAWITIMSNVNVIAVATLADLSCIILAEGVTPEGEVVELAKQKGVNILSSSLASYEIALKLSDLLK